MEQARLSAEVREGKGRGVANALRRRGFFPAIIYGHKIEPLTIQLAEKTFRRVMSSGGENVIINMELGKDVPETVIVKEVQIDPVSRQILHADFMRVSLEERITTHISVMLKGTAPGIAEGGILEFMHRDIRVECQAGKIPEHIELDVSSLNIGDQIRVGNIKVDQEITVLDDSSTIIVAIGTPSVHKEDEVVEAPVAEEVEPEVIERRKKEEEEEEK
jgi:large subunit ribosomal protein L25